MTKDVELRWTQSGKAVISFTVACNRNSDNNGADFINCVAWQKTAEFIQKHFSKGDMILLHGRLQQRNWEDNNGNKRTAHEVVVESVNFCGSKNGGNSQPVSGGTFTELPDDDGDLPF